MSYDLVTTIEEIEANLRMFLQSSAEVQSDFYKRGTNFVVQKNFTNHFHFAPVKVCGYAQNSLEDAKKYGNKRHGGLAKKAVERITNQKFLKNDLFLHDLSKYIELKFNFKKELGNFNNNILFLILPNVSDYEEFDPSIEKAGPPTSGKATVEVRLSQAKFRKKLEVIFVKCPISGVKRPELLRASHIKPWALSSELERLDSNNGILLSAHLDAAFDSGFITFDFEGNLLFSITLDEAERHRIELLCEEKKLPKQISDARQNFLHFHRNEIFRTN